MWPQNYACGHGKIGDEMSAEGPHNSVYDIVILARATNPPVTTAGLAYAMPANAVASQRGTFMSFRNGDKSRENRIRKARQKMRAKIRVLLTKKTIAAQEQATGKK